MEVSLGARPEQIVVKKRGKEANDITASVYISELLGSDLIVDVMVGRERLKIRSEPSIDVDQGDQVFLQINLEKIHLFDRKTTNSLM